MKKYFIPMICALLLSGGSVFAAGPSTNAQKTVAGILSAEPFKSSVAACLAVRVDGDTIACYEHRRKMIPASNMKLITTGLALNTLGPDYRFETRLGYVGEIRDSVLKGDLYILGGGDPTTASRTDCAKKANETFAEWYKLLSDAGIRSIEGLVIGDPRLFDCQTPENLGMEYEDIGRGYGAEPEGLNFYQNMQMFYVTPGVAVGQKPYVSIRYPDTPWMEITNSTVTSEARTTGTLYYMNTGFGPYGEVLGQFPIDRKGYQFECSNRFGAYTCAFYFCRYLSGKGFTTGGYADVSSRGLVRSDLKFQDRTRRAAQWRDIRVIGSSYSPVLSGIVSDTNAESDNFYAETLFRMLGLKSGGDAGAATCRKVETSALKAMGLNTDLGCEVSDGSGLSHSNFVSTDFFVRYLRAMRKTGAFREFFDSLPVPGQAGSTLESRFPNAPESLKSRIHMKSGSLHGVRCYSGYIESQDGDPGKMVVFSLMVNNISAKSATVSPLLDDIIAALATEN